MDDSERDGLVDFAVGVATIQFLMGGTFAALTLWIDRPFEPGRPDALAALAFCAACALSALAFLLRRNFARLVQAGTYALATLALAAAGALVAAESPGGAVVSAGLVFLSGAAARAYVSPEVRAWTR